MTLDPNLEDKIKWLLSEDNLILSLGNRFKERGCICLSEIASLHDLLSRKLSEQEDKLYGTFLLIRNCIGYAIENVINHGGSEIKIEVYATSAHFLCKISDNGHGFDVKETLNKFYEQEKYFFLSGLGLKGMNESYAKVGFNKNGNTVFIFAEIEEEKAKAIAKEYKKTLSELKKGLSS